MTEEVKELCHIKTKIYENYIKSGRSDKDELIKVTSLSSDTINKAKENLGNKLLSIWCLSFISN